MTREEAITFFVYKNSQSDQETEAIKLAIVALAQPELKEGEWIHINRLDAEYDECSCCHAKQKNGSPWMSYCPDCGAKLKRAKIKYS